jgi:hypothetical protein
MNIEEISYELAYEIVEHNYEEVSDTESLQQIIAKKLEELLS